MLSLKGHVDYGDRRSPLTDRQGGGEPTPGLCPPISDWCPHCGGPLRRQPRLFRHPCFDDTAWAIRMAENREQTTDAGSPSAAKPAPAQAGGLPSSVVRLQPGAWRVLCALRSAFGHFVSRDYLLSRLQPRKGEEADPKIIAVHLCHLRKALQGTPFIIEARRGTGCWRLIQRSDSRDQKQNPR